MRLDNCAGVVCLALLSSTLQAQRPACEGRLRPDVTGGTRWLVSAQAATRIGEDLVLFGSPRGLLVPAAGNGDALDSSFAGLRVRGASAPRTIPFPRSQHSFENARAISLSRDRARVIFRDTHVSRGGKGTEAAFGLWTAVLGPDGWTGVRHIGQFKNPARFGRELTGDPVMHDGRVIFAFAQDSDNGQGEIVILSLLNDSIATARLRHGFAGVSYVALGEHQGRLYAAFIAGRATDAGFDGVWLTQLEANGWSSPAQLASGGEHQLTEPRLLSHRDGLVLAWVERRPGEGRTWLRWKGVASASAPQVHEMLAFWPIVRGQAPFEDLLGVQTDSATGKVLELSPSGARELVSLESRAFAPIVAGHDDRPFAVTFVGSVESPDRAAQVGIYDLRCLVGAHPSSSPPRDR